MLDDLILRLLLPAVGHGILSGLNLLREIEVKRKSAKEIIGISPKLHFGYSPVQKWMGIYGTLMGGTGLAISLWHQWWVLVYLVFAPFTLICVILWYYLSGRVIVDSEGVTLKKTFWKTSIRYRDITTITHHRIQCYLVIKGGKKRIRIEYQLELFEKFVKAFDFYYAKATGSNTLPHLLPDEAIHSGLP
jgi:hypothetical protein